MAAKSWYGSAEIVGQHEAKGPCPQLSNGDGDKLPAVLLLKKYPQYYKTKQQANDITKALINHERKCFMIPYTKKTNSFNPLSTPRLTNQVGIEYKVKRHEANIGLSIVSIKYATKPVNTQLLIVHIASFFISFPVVPREFPLLLRLAYYRLHTFLSIV